jgi:hypothetical protein
MSNKKQFHDELVLACKNEDIDGIKRLLNENKHQLDVINVHHSFKNMAEFKSSIDNNGNQVSIKKEETCTC